MASQFVSSPAAKIALVAATVKVVFWFQAPANQSVKIKRIRLKFAGTDFTKVDVKVEAGRWSTAPTGSTSLTPVSKGSVAEAAVSNMQAVGHSPSAQGTDVANSVITWTVGQFETYDDRVPLGDEGEVGKGERFFIRCTSPDAVDVAVLVETEE